MPWYTRAIDGVDLRNCEEAETARMWRQIDPVLYYWVKEACERTGGEGEHGFGRDRV